MLIKTPDVYFMAAGHSEGYQLLNAFDGALLNAGIGNTNLVKMSSIIPPACERIEPVRLPFGALVPVAYAAITSSEKGQTISAAVAAAFPEDDALPGLIMEYSAAGPRDEIEEICREMARQGFDMRKQKVGRLESISVSHHVADAGAAFACVVLWDKASIK